MNESFTVAMIDVSSIMRKMADVTATIIGMSVIFDMDSSALSGLSSRLIDSSTIFSGSWNRSWSTFGGWISRSCATLTFAMSVCFITESIWGCCNETKSTIIISGEQMWVMVAQCSPCGLNKVYYAASSTIYKQ
jgi:hypothetical protein